MLKDNNFFVVHSFMVTDLQLKGNDLMIYAIIYGFSQIESQYFTGSRQYLADWTNSTVRGVQKNLNSLVERGLIGKIEKFENGVKFCSYYAKKFPSKELSSLEGENKVPLGKEQSSHNNIDNNINNKIDNKTKAEKELEGLVEEYTSNEDLKNTLRDFIKMRKEIKKPITPTGVKRMLNKLSKLATEDIDKIEILNNSITHNWQDIYQLKNKTQIPPTKKDYTPVDTSHIVGHKQTEDSIDF